MWSVDKSILLVYSETILQRLHKAGYGSANGNVDNRIVELQALVHCTYISFPLLSSLILSNLTSRMLHLYSKMGKAVGQLDYFTQNDWRVSVTFLINPYSSLLH